MIDKNDICTAQNGNYRSVPWSGKAIGAFIIFALFVSFFAPRSVAFAPVLTGLAAFFITLFNRDIGERVWCRSLFLPGLWFWGAGFVFLAGLSVIWAYDSALSFERTMNMLPIIAGGVLTASFIWAKPAQPYKSLLLWFPAIISACLILAIIELTSDFVIYRTLRGLPADTKVGGHTMNRPIVMCALFFFPCLALLRLAVMPSFLAGRKALIVGAFILLFGAAVLFSDSQSAALGSVLGALAFFCFPARWRSAWLALGILFVLGVLTSPWSVQWLFHEHVTDINHMPFLGSGDGYGAERLEIYDFVARKILEHPVLGYGIESARSLTFDSAALFYGEGDILHPHNFALQFWIEFGVIGALAVSAFACYLLWHIYKIDPGVFQRLLLACWFSFWSIASTSYNIWHGWWLGVLMCLMITIVMAASLEAANKKTGEGDIYG